MSTSTIRLDRLSPATAELVRDVPQDDEKALARVTFDLVSRLEELADASDDVAARVKAQLTAFLSIRFNLAAVGPCSRCGDRVPLAHTPRDLCFPCARKGGEIR